MDTYLFAILMFKRQEEQENTTSSQEVCVRDIPTKGKKRLFTALAKEAFVFFYFISKKFFFLVSSFLICPFDNSNKYSNLNFCVFV